MPTSGSGSARRRSSKPNAPAGRSCSAHRLGAELRRLREACALRLEDAAAELGVAASTLSRIETGHAPARTSYVRILLDLYHVSDPADQRRLTDLAREGHRKGWWAAYDHLLPPGMGAYLGLETASALSRTYALQVIPALLPDPQLCDSSGAGCPARPHHRCRSICSPRSLVSARTSAEQRAPPVRSHRRISAPENCRISEDHDPADRAPSRPGDQAGSDHPSAAPISTRPRADTAVHPPELLRPGRRGHGHQVRRRRPDLRHRTGHASSIGATFTRLCQAARSSDAPGQRDPVAGCKS